MENLSSVVVMATYNGERYIYEQLESIKEQTIQPIRVLIFDDGSTDNTVSIINEFIDSNDLSWWSLTINKKNLGWKKNFMQGFEETKEDLIFPCDQDDIWEKDKIKRMLEVMGEKTNIDVLCCNLEPFSVGKYKIDLPQYNIVNYGSNRVEQVESRNMLMNPMRQGCAMCFRSRILKDVEAVWFDDCPHDLAIWATGMSKNSLYILNESLIRFRRHPGTNTPQNEKNKSCRIKLLNIQLELVNRILSYDVAKTELDKNWLYEMSGFYQERIDAITESNYFKALLLLRKLALYPRYRAWAADFISMLRG